LLQPVPFEYLVADQRMLPESSSSAAPGATPLTGAIRFFYVDPNWVGALLDGALSIGLESSRYGFFHEMTCGVLQRAAAEAAQVLRGADSGSPPPPGAPDAISGLLIRSPVISGWPNLAVRPLLGGDMLRTLRMDHMAPGVLLCLFGGVPDRVMLAEPQEGLRFGIADGAVELRNLAPPVNAGDLPFGAVLGQRLTVTGQYTRSDGSVLDIGGGASGGLAQALDAALKAHSPPAAAVNFGAAGFALQMVNAPEQLTFQSGGST
jgi:hypothetical protein